MLGVNDHDETYTPHGIYFTQDVANARIGGKWLSDSERDGAMHARCDKDDLTSALQL